MTVHFIGAGPGAADLITLRGRDLIARCPVCLYAGSLVPQALLAHCPPGARIVDTAPLDLDAIIAECAAAHARGLDVARLHSGDLSIWSAMGEQLRRLDAAGVPFSVTPGVPAFAAAAAALANELTAPMDLDAIVAECAAAHESGLDVARLHSGDLSIWSAMGEQLRRLDALAIPCSVTPGVPAFAAAAAALRRELTLPGVAQSLVLTRTSGRASAMPEGETLAAFAATGATLAIHLSIHALDRVIGELTPHYGEDCPAAIVCRASWPDERIVRGALGDLAARAREAAMERTALILVGPALGAEDFRESALYDADYVRRFRSRPSA